MRTNLSASILILGVVCLLLGCQKEKASVTQIKFDKADLMLTIGDKPVCIRNKKIVL